MKRMRKKKKKEIIIVDVDGRTSPQKDEDESSSTSTTDLDTTTDRTFAKPSYQSQPQKEQDLKSKKHIDQNHEPAECHSSPSIVS